MRSGALCLCGDAATVKYDTTSTEKINMGFGPSSQSVTGHACNDPDCRAAERERVHKFFKSHGPINETVLL